MSMENLLCLIYHSLIQLNKKTSVAPFNLPQLYLAVSSMSSVHRNWLNHKLVKVRTKDV